MLLACPHCRRWSRYPSVAAAATWVCPQCRRSFQSEATATTGDPPPAARPQPDARSVRATATGGAAVTRPVRDRRCLADADQLRRAFADSTALQIEPLSGSPDDGYRIEYRVRGVEPGENQVPRRRERHQVEIRLGPDYPRSGPVCCVLTPVFHPNVETGVAFELQDWRAATRLPDVIAGVGALLTYQIYDLTRPRNAAAAAWAGRFRERLPLDPRRWFGDPAAAQRAAVGDGGGRAAAPDSPPTTRD